MLHTPSFTTVSTPPSHAHTHTHRLRARVPGRPAQPRGAAAGVKPPVRRPHGLCRRTARPPAGVAHATAPVACFVLACLCGCMSHARHCTRCVCGGMSHARRFTRCREPCSNRHRNLLLNTSALTRAARCRLRAAARACDRPLRATAATPSRACLSSTSAATGWWGRCPTASVRGA
jgi:hypothetical protein